MTEKVGTPYYIAPEVLNKNYSKSCDLWSIGVITYILLSNSPPFNAATDEKVLEVVKTGQFDYSAPIWETISA
jgi:calcium-dependent protein kinase